MGRQLRRPDERAGAAGGKRVEETDGGRKRWARRDGRWWSGHTRATGGGVWAGVEARARLGRDTVRGDGETPHAAQRTQLDDGRWGQWCWRESDSLTEVAVFIRGERNESRREREEWQARLEKQEAQAKVEADQLREAAHESKLREQALKMREQQIVALALPAFGVRLQSLHESKLLTDAELYTLEEGIHHHRQLGGGGWRWWRRRRRRRAGGETGGAVGRGGWRATLP